MADPVALLSLNAPYALFGKSATYTPPGGGSSVSCRVLVDRSDRELNVDGANIFAEGFTIEVRASEVVPVRGGEFVVEELAYVVKDSPKSNDPERLAYICTVSRGTTYSPSLIFSDARNSQYIGQVV